MSRKKNTTNIPLFKKSLFKVVELLFNEPNKEFHLRGISQKSGVSTTAVARAVEELERCNLVTVDKNPITSKIKTNSYSREYLAFKRIFNLYQLERFAIVATLKDHFKAQAVVLFGSFAKGEDVAGSDVDLLILSNRKIDDKTRKFLEGKEKELKRSINLTVVGSMDKSSAEFRNSVANGIVLHGYLKVL